MTHTSVKNEVVNTSERQAFVVQSTKIKAAPSQALQQIVCKQISGRLTIGDPNDNSVFWRVYVGEGKLHFATSTMGQKERISYLLQCHCPDLANLSLATGQSDYQSICNFWHLSQLSLPQLRKLLFDLTQEALIQLMALPQATIQFEKTVGIDPLLLSVPFRETILPVRGTISQWVQLRSEISSPFERPEIINREKFSLIMQSKLEDPQKIQLLTESIRQKNCIYEIAYRLRIDVLKLATIFQSLVKTGVVKIHPYCYGKTDERPVIACIDDSKTVQRNVKLTLESSGYKVLGLIEPVRALSTLARNKPALVLMDISMPEIDGYELCRLLRQSSLLREIPIVMLTGRDGMIDRIRARMVGATDYITKPFDPQHLLNTVKKLTCEQKLEEMAL